MLYDVDDSMQWLLEQSIIQKFATSTLALDTLGAVLRLHQKRTLKGFFPLLHGDSLLAGERLLHSRERKLF